MKKGIKVSPEDLAVLYILSFAFEKNPSFVPQRKLEKGLSLSIEKKEEDKWQISVSLSQETLKEHNKEFWKKVYPIGILEFCKKLGYKEALSLQYVKTILIQNPEELIKIKNEVDAVSFYFDQLKNSK